MEKRRLGRTDLELTVIGLGTWAIGGPWNYGWGPQNDNDSKEAILESLELGINWIDTAPAYGLGVSEICVGAARKDWIRAGNPPPIIATKCGLYPVGNGAVQSRLSQKSIIEECNSSLKRLGVDCIDLYQIHWPNPPGQIGEAYQALLDLKKEGKIRWPGISNFSKSQLEHIKRIGEVYSLQPPYSLVNRGIEGSLLQYCDEEQIGVIAYSPLQAGLLTGRMTRDYIHALPDDDWRKTKGDFFKEPKLTKVLSYIEAIKNSPLGCERPLLEIAIQWILNRKGVTAAICGARKKGQMSEIVKALNWKITSDELAMLDEYYQQSSL